MSRQPNDEIAKILAGLMEKLIRDIGDGDDRRMVRFTLVTASGTAPDEQGMNGEDRHIPYEVVEGPDRIFVTAELPAILTMAPYVDIKSDRIILYIEEKEMVIDLPAKIDVTRSSYQIRRRTLDVLCYKR